MTAYLAIAQTNGAHLLSDGAATDEDGVIEYIVSKPTLFPSLNLAVAVTGLVHPDWLRDDMIAAHPIDQIDAVQLLPALAHGLAGRNRMTVASDPEVVLTAISWHERTGAAAWTCATGDAATRRGWRPHEVHRIRAALEDVTDPSAVLGREVDLFDPTSFDPATDGVTLMEDIRSRPADPELWGGRTDHYGVGGHVELVTANANGLSLRRLKTWPEDRVGHRISPRHRKIAA